MKLSYNLYSQVKLIKLWVPLSHFAKIAANKIIHFWTLNTLRARINRVVGGSNRKIAKCTKCISKELLFTKQ